MWLSGLVSVLRCRLRGGHVFELQSEPSQVFLQCVQCPRRTPGWPLTPPLPVVFRDPNPVARIRWSTRSGRTVASV